MRARLSRLRATAVAAAGVLTLAGCTLTPGADDGAEGDRPSADPSVTRAPSADLSRYYGQELSWGDCDGIDPPRGVGTSQHECATLAVPLDYDDPAADEIELALTRLPASGDRMGSLVLNPGGPGGSGVDYALQATFVTSDEVREVYDVVGFDPRGVARSAPVDCLDDEQVDQLHIADPSPDDTAELVELERVSGLMADGCADDPVAPFVDSVSAARDLDVLRAALGEAQLDYLGKSYGTILGALYLELFPDRAGRMVLDGAVDLTPRVADDLTLAVEQVRGFETALRSFVADCLEQDDCPLSGDVDDGVGQVAALLTGLETAPLPTEDPDRPLGQGLAVVALVGPLYQYDAWPLLRQALTLGLQGDGTLLLLINDLFSERQEDGTYRGNSGEAIFAVNCIDGGADPEGLDDLTIDDLDELNDVLSAEAPTFGPQFGYGGLPCLTWPHDPVGWPVIDGAGAPPVVVIGTSRDPATPLVWAERLSEQLDSAVLVTYDGDGHTAYGTTGSACVDEAVDEYWLEGTVPEDGLVCVADY